MPNDLPRPRDDGAADHLIGKTLPTCALRGSDGLSYDLSTLPGITVLYIYPMTGTPGVPLPKGWDDIPGARGCTPQACSFRDHHGTLWALGARVFGLSTQSAKAQSEAAERLHLPYPLLSDERKQYANALSLPLFKVEGRDMIKRLTLLIQDGCIANVQYPVFPSTSALPWARDAIKRLTQAEEHTA